ncbi:MAG: hypothetical protein LUD17_08570 [Bacteroidales bacterium]|nr:hypothetical protein [Bacteroidales bacterium]
MKKLFTSLLATAAVGFAAQADTFTFTDGTIVLGEVYEITAYSAVEGSFVAPSTGTLIQDGMAELRINGLEPVTNSALPSYGQYGQMWEWSVVAGETYTVSNSFVLNGGQVMYIMASDYLPEVIDIDPAEGSTITPVVNQTGEISVQFNSSVTAKKAYLIAGEEQIELTIIQDVSNRIAVNVQTALETLYDNGTINKKGGDAVQIKITGIQNGAKIPYGTDGTLLINYIAGPNAARLLSTSVVDGGTLKSYYPEGDADGIWTFVFDTDLANDGQTYITLQAGNIEESGYYEQIPVEIDGATVTCDITGQLRHITVISSGEYVAMKLVNVRDSEGNMSAGSGQGNVGSYSYSLVYDYIEPMDIVSEFYPVSGGSLVGVDELEIWFTNSDMITYDGVVFSYPADGETKEIVVLKEECQIELSGTETTLLVTVPDEVKGQPTTVTLYNMVSYDGYDHSRQVMGYFDQFVAWLIEPFADGTAMESTGTSDFVIRTNETPGYMRYDFYAEVTLEHADGWVGGAEFTQQSNGYWRAENADYVCFADFTPYMVISAYASAEAYENGEAATGSFTFIFEGTTAAFENSPVEFESISPEAGVITVTDDFCFTVKFNGMVSIDTEASGLSEGLDSELVAFERIVAVADEDDPEGYANTWLIYPGADYLANHAAFTVCIKAYDYDGLLVKGNVTEGRQDYLAFSYTVDGSDSIIGIAADGNGTYEVYNLQGIRVLSTTDASALSTLRPGIYLINGQKRLVK